MQFIYQGESVSGFAAPARINNTGSAPVLQVRINGNWVNVASSTGSAAFTLPVAGTETLGGIKVGSNLSIDANGVLSATAAGGGSAETSRAITTVSGSAFTPEHRGIYKHTLSAGEQLTLQTSALGTDEKEFELWLVQPQNAVTFSWQNGIYWGDSTGNVFSGTNTAPATSNGGSTYCIAFLWDGAALLANLAWEKSAAPVTGTTLSVTGACNAGVNGTYSLINASASGNARKWMKNGGGMYLVYGTISANYTNTGWVFTSSETPENLTAYYYDDRTSAFANPWNVDQAHWLYLNGMPPAPVVTATA